MLATVAQRLRLHYQRLATARRSFYLHEPRYLRGLSDSYGRPPGLAFDDRGLLLVRMGFPEHDEACPEEVAVPPDSLPNRLGRCWIYERPTGYQIFYLTTKDRFSTAGDIGSQSWPDGDFRLQDDLSQQAEPGTRFFQQYVINADLPADVVAELIRRGPAHRLERLARDSVIRVRDLSDGWDATLGAIEARHYNRRVKLNTRRVAERALMRISDKPKLSLGLDMLFETLRFQSPSGGNWNVWLIGAVRARQLQSSSDDRESATYDISGRLSALDASRYIVQGMSPVSVPTRLVPESAALSVRGSVAVGPGLLPVAFAIEDLNAPGTGAWIQDTINVPSPSGLPQLSDIAVAQAEGGTWTRDGRTFLQVSPAHVTNPDGSIHVYFEAYGVRVGERYEVELRLAPTESADRIWRLEPGDLGFRLSFTAEMPGTIGRHHQVLDLSDTEPGAYVLGVRIRDERTGAYSLPSVTDLFVAERG